jgi:uncharacterized protein (DUF885 family)
MSDAHSQALEALINNFLADYFAFHPPVAGALGLHAYDGQVMNLQSDAIAAYIEKLQGYRQRLDQIDPTGLERLAAFEYGLLRWQIEAEIWRWSEECEYRRNPMVYAYDAMVDNYVKRDYAPREERAAALAQHLRQIPATMQVARQNLQPHVPRVLVEESLTIFAGLITFFKQNLPEALGPLTDPALEQAVWAARDKAVAALEGFTCYLRNDLLPAAHDEFAIGAEQFRAMLRYYELVDLPLDQVLAIGEADLARNQAEIVRVAAQINPDWSIQQHMQALGRNHPSADQLIDETRALLENLRSFLIDRDIVTVPSEVRCQVEETPPFARWAFAMMSTAGPFEEHASESFYYVTLPEPHWSPQDIEGWLTKFDYATLTDVSIHEAYPGHYIHFLHIHNAPSRLAKVFTAYSHIESWAHYVEQMMLEQGYGDGDPVLRLAQLAEALTRNCRYVCAIKMHTQGMTVEEATHFFMQNAYMDEVTARQEARRGTHDPGYLNYTLGKLMLLKLLADYRAAHGDTFSLKRFHDEYIGYGAPPIPLLRRLLLPHDDGVLL